MNSKTTTVQVGKINEDNSTTLILSNKTILENGTSITMGSISTKIDRDAASELGSDVYFATGTFATGTALGDYHNEFKSTIVTGTNPKVDARNQVHATSSFLEGGLKVKLDDKTVSRIVAETANSTKRQETTRVILKTKVLANGATIVEDSTQFTVTYNLGRADQATKESYKKKVTQVEKDQTTTVVSNTDTGFTAKRRMLLTAAHEQSNGNADSILVSCFTGYGGASLLKVNTPTVGTPDIADCVKLLAKEKPDFTVEKLRTAVKEFFEKNPAYQE